MRETKGVFGKIVTLIAVAMGIFQLYTAQFGLFPANQQRALHLAFAMALVFLLFPFSNRFQKNRWYLGLDIIAVILIVTANIYIFVEFENLPKRFGIPNLYDYILGIITVILVLEGARRLVGWILPVLGALFIIYAYFGPYMPGVLAHRGFNVERLVYILYVSQEGLYGSILGVSANFIVLYVIFAAFLQETGLGEFIIDFSNAVAGAWRGGPAKVAVAASGLFASINGTAVANVLGTGSFTIPLMKRVGYEPKFAASVEAVASTGGQLTPPVMGASAFVMAEVLGVPYIKICVAAMIPAILYYWSTWVMVDFRAAKTGLKGQPRSVLPSARKLMKKSGFMLIPLLILLFALAVLNVSAMKAALIAIYSALIVSFIDKLRKRLPIFEAFKAVGHETLRGLERGVKDSLLIVSACATAGILIGCIDITGMGLKLSGTLIDLAGGNLLLLLILTMIASIILGMGLPTLACYIILAVLVAPTLTKIGLLPIAAHLFVFYFGILSAITPPVAGAVYAAAGLAGTGIISTGISTVRLGLLAFILPYFFVYWPALLFQGPILDIFLAFISACVGVYFFGSAIEGYLFKPLNFLWRVYFFIGAFLCIAPGLLTDLIGYGMLGSGLAWHLYQRKKVRVFTGRKEETEVLFSINPK